MKPSDTMNRVIAAICVLLASVAGTIAGGVEQMVAGGGQPKMWLQPDYDDFRSRAAFFPSAAKAVTRVNCNFSLPMTTVLEPSILWTDTIYLVDSTYALRHRFGVCLNASSVASSSAAAPAWLWSMAEVDP